MSEEIKKKIQKITDKIVKETNPEKIILFGSYAWGKPHKDSDLDLFVVENKTGSRRKRQMNLRRLLLDFDMPADILSYNNREIEDRLKIGDTFIKKIIQQGLLVYSKD